MEKWWSPIPALGGRPPLSLGGSLAAIPPAFGSCVLGSPVLVFAGFPFAPAPAAPSLPVGLLFIMTGSDLV
eukprot:5948009-Karenia_brevis.AAC.1